MTRALEGRLRKLEANAPSKPVRLVFSSTSDEAEWERAIAALIASGRASRDDRFVRIGWIRQGC